MPRKTGCKGKGKVLKKIRNTTPIYKQIMRNQNSHIGDMENILVA